MKLPITIVLVSALLLVSSHVRAHNSRNSRAFEDSGKLSASANSFLSAWLVKRDVRKAMQYVSINPVLGKCDLPSQQGNIPRSASQKRKMVEHQLSSVLKALPKYASLSAAIKPSSIPPAAWFDVETTDTVQILRIKPGEDGSLLCKFEESASYRKALRSPGVYYVGFETMNARNAENKEWISAWRKERQQWRLISIGLLED